MQIYQHFPLWLMSFFVQAKPQSQEDILLLFPKGFFFFLHLGQSGINFLFMM